MTAVSLRGRLRARNLIVTPQARSHPGRGFPLRAALPMAARSVRYQARPSLPPPDAGPGAYPEDTMDDGYDLLAVRIRRGTTIDGAVVALCPDADGTVTADVCIDGPPVP